MAQKLRLGHCIVGHVIELMICVFASSSSRLMGLQSSTLHPLLGAGPNGCGKSTLLRLVMGREDPIKGAVELGEYAIEPNYFEQNQARSPRARRGSMPACGPRLFMTLNGGCYTHAQGWPC